jgi:hypothetical protein
MKGRMKMKRIDRFIETFPDQVASEFKRLLREFYEGTIEETDAKSKLHEMIDTAFNTVKGTRKLVPKGFGGRRYWFPKS